MNKDNAKEYLPLVQALADGKTLQIYNKKDEEWQDVENVQFLIDSKYRIKPESIEFDLWVSYHHDGRLCSATTTDMSEHGWQKIRVRQIEE